MVFVVALQRSSARTRPVRLSCSSTTSAVCMTDRAATRVVSAIGLVSAVR